MKKALKLHLIDKNEKVTNIIKNKKKLHVKDNKKYKNKNIYIEK